MSLTSVVFNGAQIANFAWIKSGQLSQAEIETYLDVHFSDLNVSSDANTLFLAKFNGTLDAGSYADTGEQIVGWDIYKQKTGESILRYVGHVGATETQMVDHCVENGVEYTYY
jgi:hypothetical protein